MKPISLEELIQNLKSLPGISKKQAEKIAYNLVTNNKDEAEGLIKSIDKAINVINRCTECNGLSEEKICYICSDKKRKKTLIVVETPLDVFKFEESLSIKPYFHVLGGLVNVSKNIDVDDLNISTLKKRADKYTEIILALSPNLEGIVTSNYIKSLLVNNKVTQLAQGIPLGAAMEYVDDLTLKAAMDNRKEFE